MTAGDYFAAFCAVVSLALIVVGIGILNNRRLELGALMGIYPLLGGVAFGLIALVTFLAMHVSLRFV